MDAGYWVAPKLWPDGTVFILGGGPSLADLDLSLIHQYRVIGVNDAYLLGDFVDVMIFSDSNWYFRYHRWKLRRFKGLKVSTNKQTLQEPGIKTLQRMEDPICTLPGCIGWGRNTGLAAINLALVFGVKTIVLLGFDMCKRKCRCRGKGFDRNQVQKTGEPYTNWHKNVNPKDQSKEYDFFMQKFEDSTKPINMLGVRVINANKHSKLQCFEKMTYEDALCAIS